MLGFIIYLFVVGIVAGFLARLLVPGRDPMGFWATVLLGVVGSFIGGFLGYVLFGKDLDEGALQASGIIGSILGAIVALLIYRAVTGSRRRSVLRRSVRALILGSPHGAPEQIERGQHRAPLVFAARRVPLLRLHFATPLVAERHVRRAGRLALQLTRPRHPGGR